MEEFKTQVPILQVICNPGLRDRHWEQMTEVVGIDNFAPEPGASVSRYLDMKLEPYLDQFNIISESATKVWFQIDAYFILSDSRVIFENL